MVPALHWPSCRCRELSLGRAPLFGARAMYPGQPDFFQPLGPSKKEGLNIYLASLLLPRKSRKVINAYCSMKLKQSSNMSRKTESLSHPPKQASPE